MNAELIIAILGIGFICVVLFIIYYFFKLIEFTLTATNLYRKMVRRQDAMIRLLIDIRDNTKEYDLSATLTDEEDSSVKEDVPPLSSEGRVPYLPVGEEAGGEFCHHCGAELQGRTDNCPSCGKRL